MKTNALIVFDMDGVLIDVSDSYRETVRQSARSFFTGARSWQSLPDPLFSLEELAQIKQSGGLNNDWDLTATILSLLLYPLDGTPNMSGPVSWEIYRIAMTRCDVSDLANFLKNEDHPLISLLERHGKRLHPLAETFYANDVGSGNIIKQIFQEIYLGAKLFESTYGIEARAHGGEGLIHQERLLVDGALLKRISEQYLLAIATGRPGSEADFALDHFNIRQYFFKVYALDECLKEEARILKEEDRTVCLSKPDPFMLDAIATPLQNTVHSRYYIGDMPDDMIAAANADTGFKGIGILISSPDKTRLRDSLVEAGADEIIENFDDLERIVQFDDC